MPTVAELFRANEEWNEHTIFRVTRWYTKAKLAVGNIRDIANYLDYEVYAYNGTHLKVSDTRRVTK